MSQWGRDHWSTFAYLETVVVDHRGIPNLNRMRCNHELHPGLTNWNPIAGVIDGSKYPTRLKGGVEINDHDDWSCVEDMESEGLVEIKGTGINPVWELTEKGSAIAHELRTFRGNGGSFSDFSPRTVSAA